VFVIALAALVVVAHARSPAITYTKRYL
jgi:hypothetical protein